jgi:hypothetical protein
MTTFTASPEAPILDAAGGPGLSMQSVAQLVAGTLCGVHRVGGQFVRVNATVGDGGYIERYSKPQMIEKKNNPRVAS